MGLFSFLGGILGGGSAKKGMEKAAKSQEQMLGRAIDEQQRQFDTTRADFMPWQEAGKAGLGQLGDLVGIHGADPQAAAIEALKASPLYQQLFRTGEETLLQTASATGGLRGGNTQRGLADFGADTLMATIERQLASLGGLAGMGMGAAESVGNFGANKANAVSGFLKDIGGAQASMHLGKAGVNSQMWNNAGGFLDSVVSAFLPGGGGF